MLHLLPICSIIIRPLTLTDVKYTSSEGQEHLGIIKMSVCNETTKPLACHNHYSPSVAYFSDSKICMPLSQDDGLSNSTRWEYYEVSRDTITFEGHNSNNIDVNVKFQFTCDHNTDIHANAIFDVNSEYFVIDINTKYACRLPLNKTTLIFNYYRHLIVIFAFSVGIFMNYFGYEKIRRTLAILGATVGFFTTLFLVTTLTLTSYLKSVSTLFCSTKFVTFIFWSRFSSIYY